MKDRVIIYAPCDGFVEDIKSIQDSTFADGLVGQGFFIKPISNDFFSPINGKISQIFHTKHAIIINANGVDVLMHIGIDTVKLEGKPFEIMVSKNEEVSPKDLLVKVNLEIIKQKSISTDTPIVFVSEKKLKYKLLKIGEVKAGTPICEIDILKDDPISTTPNVVPVNFKGKYETIAENINKYIGGKNNYKKFYNCMTRLRIIIKDKKIVEIEKINKIPVVKGTNWNGEELQIIIGGEVYRVREALEKYYNSNENENFKMTKIKKTSFGNKLLAGLGGVVTPIIPVIIGAGLLKAIASILQISGLIDIIPTGTSASDLNQYDLFSIVVFMVSDLGLLMMGFFFGYSTTRYLGGNTYVGGLIALILVAPSLWFGNYAFTYFTIWDVRVGLRGYTSSVIPQVGAAFIYVFFDKWVQKWMPKSVDIIFRHTFCIAFTTIIVFMVVGPFLGFFEALLGVGVKSLETLPLGIGTAIYSGLRQVLVLTGLHSAITALIGAAGWYSGQSFNLMMAVPLAVFGQIGATLGVVFRTKNSNLRTAGYGALPAAVFGITEPVIYGVNLPKVRPFILGCLAASIGGLVAGIVGVNAYNGAGQGILFFTGIFPTDGSVITQGELIKNVLGYTSSALLAVSVGVLLVLVFYKERENEINGTKKINKLIYKILFKKFDVKKRQIDSEITKELENLLEIVSGENYLKIKNLEKGFDKRTRVQLKISKLQNKEEKLKEKFAVEANKAFNKSDSEKVLQYNYLFKEVNFEKDYLELNTTLNKIVQEVEDLNNWFVKTKKEYLDKVKKLIHKLNEENNTDKFNYIYNSYYNVINSLEISYQIIEPLDTNLKFKKW